MKRSRARKEGRKKRKRAVAGGVDTRMEGYERSNDHSDRWLEIWLRMKLIGEWKIIC